MLYFGSPGCFIFGNPGCFILGALDTLSLGALDALSLGALDTLSLGALDALSLGALDALSLGALDALSLGALDALSLEPGVESEGLVSSRSKWSQCSTPEKICWLAAIPFRTLLCLVNIFCFVFAYFGFMLPVLWARKLWPRFYWGYEGKLYMWLQAFVAYWGYTADYDVYEYGDDIRKYAAKGRVLVIVNHQSTADVNVLFTVLQTKGVATRKVFNFMLDFGVILLVRFQVIPWSADNLADGCYVPSFGIETGVGYGRKHNFPHLEWCTLPRTGAIKAILEEVGPREGDNESDGNNGRFRKVRSGIQLLKDAVGEIHTRPPITHILDVTIAYPNGHPLSILTLCFGTREQCDIAVHYKMHPVEEVPFNDDIKLRDWLYTQYAKKDKLLANYYQYGEFEPDEPGERIVFSWTRIVGHWAFWLSEFLDSMQTLLFGATLYFFFFDVYLESMRRKVFFFKINQFPMS
uniref:Acyltransf_C domain-containing protein n=1 Tax=Meloidogyne hapla TaxID=6305 RepID=A0A1I8B1Q2_MELHA